MTPEQQVLVKLAALGRRHPSAVGLEQVSLFSPYFRRNRAVSRAALNRLNDGLTIRELAARYLLLNAVLDQGPDMAGVRMLLVEVMNDLYKRNICVLHHPDDLADHIGDVVGIVNAAHAKVKGIRSKTWARANQTLPNKYLLLLENARQILPYVVYRWGTPLLLPLLLEQRLAARPTPTTSTAPLIDWIAAQPSTEIMTRRLKADPEIGLGKAIGDKACHLYGKWVTSTYDLVPRTGVWQATPGWGPFSFEVPFDSNAGRVLWRTGLLLKFATLQEYREQEVIQQGAGKGGHNYLRITNIRDMKVTAKATIPGSVARAYRDICVNHLKTHKRAPSFVRLHQVFHALLLDANPPGNYGIAELDDGLMYIGTTFCFNHSSPNCSACPLAPNCEGHQANRALITSYRT